jgi:hypothetical protein
MYLAKETRQKKNYAEERRGAQLNCFHPKKPTSIKKTRPMQPGHYTEKEKKTTGHNVIQRVSKKKTKKYIYFSSTSLTIKSLPI